MFMSKSNLFLPKFDLQNLPLRLPMSHVCGALFILLALLTALTPPGLCACWLIPQVEIVHPHVSKEHATSEHPHDYLFQLSQTTPAEVMPLVILPATVWITLAFASRIWWRLPGLYFREAGWQPTIPLPPPKAL